MNEIARDIGKNKPIEKLRERLARAGYTPTPITGKVPVLDGWQKKTEVTAGDLHIWSQLFPRASNTGILCHNTPVFDIDIRHPEAAAAIEEMVRERYEERGRILVRFGNSPKRAIPFRTDEPFKKILVDLISPNGSEARIEFLGDGQQCASFGVHPDTHKPYTWTGGEPGAVPREELPYTREAEAQELVNAAVEILVEQFGFSPVERKPKTNGNGHSADWSGLFSSIQSGASLHDSIRDMAMNMVKSGMDDGAVVNALRGMMENSTAVRGERWRERYDDIPRAVATAREKIGSPEAKPDEGLPWLDMSDWDTKPVPEREWCVLNRIPAKQAGTFSGEGGSGKSIVELMRATAHVEGLDWLGVMPKIGPAWYIGAEDDADEIHRRMAAIREHYQVTFRQMVDRGLRIMPLIGKSATLAEPNANGKLQPTALYKQLLKEAETHRPVSITIDPLSKIFAGNEIDRVHAYALMDLMQALALATGGCVNVVMHPSLTGINTGTGNSGSTGWIGAPRFRSYMSGVKDQGEPADGLRKIEFKKNQYGPLSETIVLEYRKGLFLPLRGVSSIEKAAFEARADDAYLAVLRKLTDRGEELSAAMQSHAYAPTVMIKDPGAKGLRKDDLVKAQERLIEAGKVYIHTLRPGTTREKKVFRAS
jgi:RecA-family ATPase